VDSVSQIALGATIGEVTLGQRLGRKAMLLGGLLGTLPDLDVVASYSDAVASFTYHRSWSHSLFVLTIASFLIAWLLSRYYPNRWLATPVGDIAEPQHTNPPYKVWLMSVLLILITHPLLDGFTLYGTQLFWPLPFQPVAWGSIFIIDPLYTLPLIIALFVAWKKRRKARTTALIGIVVSCAYLLVTLFIQQHVRTKSIRSLQEQGMAYNNVLIAPTPLSLLWRIVSMDGNEYHEGFTSLFDDAETIRFISYPSQLDIIKKTYSHWPVRRMDWFTNGMISASVEEEKLIINDLRMGVESSYIFRFDVGGWREDQLQPTESTLLPINIDRDRMKMLLRRVTDEDVSIAP